MKRFLVLPLLFASSLASARDDDYPTPKPRLLTFNQPTLHGKAFDWCKTWADECGKPAADWYCVDKGFDQSYSYAIRPDIGATVLSTGQECNADFCDGFQYIKCVEYP